MRNRGRLFIAVAAAIFLLLIFGRAAAVFYTEALWYAQLGQDGVFWTRILTIAGVCAAAGAAAAVLILLNLWYVIRQLGPVHLRRRYANIEIAEQVPRAYLLAGAVAVSVLAGLWLATMQFGGDAAVAVAAALRADAWGTQDPLFGHDVSFYVFTLPVIVRLAEFLLIALLWSLLLVGIGYVLIGAVRVRTGRWEIDERPRLHFAILAAALFATFGVHLILGRYGLLLAGNGFNDAIGYTDVYARLPARLVLGVLAMVCAAAIVWGALRRLLLPPVLAFAAFLLAAIGMGVIYPAVLQKVQVEPNQLAREIRFIRWNMEFTRAAYGLDEIRRQEFAYRRAAPEAWAAMAPALDALPLWDQAPLQTLYNEIQARYRYYTFPDVDFDRYPTADGAEHVAIGVREFAKEGLSPDRRTWQSIHLNPLYTRGMGVALTPTAARQGGDPLYWISDVQPVQVHPAAPPSLALTEPSVFFGETMDDYAVVGHVGSFSGEDGDSIATPVPGVATGVPLNSFVRILAFATRFGDQNLLFARELGDTSRILYHRNVRERVMKLAPFLLWDTDPHPVVLDGRVIWVIDGYSVSGTYPLSRPIGVTGYGGVRYMRSSAKAVVDGVSGAVTIYTIGEIDPIVRTYAGLFPGLFRGADAMPEGLQAHLRYPSLMFSVQADLLKDYHLDRAERFYAGQDMWDVPSESTDQQAAAFRPEYMQLPMPGSTEPEFLLLHPFIARQRQNLTSILIARSDPPHYGELVLLDMPRDDEIRGPAQIQSIIEQDPAISQQLSLWRQQGSNVQVGRLRMIPTENSILYVRPLFLSARDRGIPQLQRVIATDGATVTMERDLGSAVAALLGEAPPQSGGEADPDAASPLTGAAGPAAQVDWNRRALELMREAESRLREGDFAGFGAAWERLRQVLEQRPPEGL